MELQRSMGRVEGKMDTLTEKIDEALSAGLKRTGRIEALERWRAWTVGISVGMSLVMSVLVTLATLFIKLT